MHTNHSTKRKYHPLIILMYTSGMLDHLQINEIPRNTRWRWNHFDHTNYYGYELAEDYIDKFDQVKEIYSSKYAYKATRFICSMSNGYKEIVAEFEQQKSILRKNALRIVDSIDRMKYNSGVNLDKICRLLGVSKDWYYRHRKKLNCTKSIINRCLNRFPNQLTVEEVITIENLFNDQKNENRNKLSIYYKAMTDKIISCGRTTFYNYAKYLGFTETRRKKKKIKKTGFKASRVFEWLHVDITYISTLEDGIQKVAFIKDNFSKAILHYKSTDGKAGSDFITALFQEVFDKYNLFDKKLPINILSDGGPENKGSFLEWLGTIKAPPIISKITAQTDDFPFSNSMSEFTHRIYKSEFMKGLISLNKMAHYADLKRFVEEYNYHRYPSDHFGYTPMEVLNGKIPDRNKFKKQIKNGQTNRVKVNQSYDSCIPFIGCGE